VSTNRERSTSTPQASSSTPSSTSSGPSADTSWPTSYPTDASEPDFIDVYRVKTLTPPTWDIKSMHSDWPPGSNHKEGQSYPDGYTNDKFTKTVTKQIDVSGRNVVIDTRNANQQAIDSMNKIVEEKGWKGKVILYP
jgi:hypothetical protein